MYYVIWWNAHGDAQQSELLTKAEAELYASTLWPEQEPQLMYVNR